jgi:hypothetical protein
MPGIKAEDKKKVCKLAFFGMLIEWQNRPKKDFGLNKLIN